MSRLRYRWEITDTTVTDNTLYTYKAQSNCGGTTPYVLYNFANINCPVVTLTPADTEVEYSFPDLGGEISKYEVSIYDSTGTVLISTQTILPAFSNPVTGIFEYLTEGTTYVVRVKVFISDFSKTCEFESVTTGGGEALQGFISNSVVASVTGCRFNSQTPTYISGTDFPIGTMQSGVFETEETGSDETVEVDITGVFTSVSFNDTNGTGHTLLYTGPGTYQFEHVALQPGGSNWFIQVN